MQMYNIIVTSIIRYSLLVFFYHTFVIILSIFRYSSIVFFASTSMML